MIGTTFDTLTRTASRRHSLLALGGAGLAAALGDVTAAAAKKKSGKRRGKKCKKPKPGPTCPGACPDTCHLCATRREGSPVCGDTITFSCTNLPCTADNDCVSKLFKGNPVPYCITGYTTSSGGVAQLGCDGACAGLTACQ